MVHDIFSDRLPITGRRRFSRQSQSSSRDELDELDRRSAEEMKGKTFLGIGHTKKCLMDLDIESVIKRLAKASGLDNMTWEVRVTDSPGKCLSNTAVVAGGKS